MPDGTPFHPYIHYWVGGNTKFYGAALLRLREQDFGEVRHVGGISPAWPISYAEFEPYYSRAEQLYHAHGKHGEDPTDPPASMEYPHPPISHEPRIRHLDGDLRAMGYQPFHLPLGLMLDEQNPHKSKCIRCDTCDAFACVVQAKADAHVVCVEPALATGNVTIVTGAFVKRLETDPSGRVVTKVMVERNGEPEEYAADLVVVSAGALNSAAILLRSVSDKHPNGLANSSDLLGRNYICHQNSTFLAISKEPNYSIYPKTLALSDFYFASKDWEYPNGLHPDARQDQCRGSALRSARSARDGRYDAGRSGTSLARLLASVGGSARPEQPRDAQRQGRDRAALSRRTMSRRMIG